MKPMLMTFDIFGTVLDWRKGMREDVLRAGKTLTDSTFDEVIDAQAAEESGEFKPYGQITAASLVKVLRMEPGTAERIGQVVGRWPLFPDSQNALRLLMKHAPCVAMTNSDRSHGEQVQEQLGFRLTDWVCAEEVRIYKPATGFWNAVSMRRKIGFGPQWWHVSAYADYDLRVANELGLTCVYVSRPHARHGNAHYEVKDLIELAKVVERA